MDTSSPNSLTEGATSTLHTLALEYERYRNPSALTVVAALDELAVTLEEIAAGRTMPLASDRKSIHRDVQLALEAVGPGLERIGSPDLRKVRIQELARLSTVFSDPGAAGEYGAMLRTTIDHLRTAQAVEAAFDDVLAALNSGVEDCAMCALRVAQLAELVELRGHDWTTMHMALSFYSAGDDLARSRAELASAARDDLVAVWLVFGNAELGKGYQRVGQVQFFRGLLTPENIRDGCPALGMPEFERATELDAHIIQSYFGNIQAEHHVLVRVEMTGPRARKPPNGLTKPPIEWARDLVLGIVEAASFAVGGTEWVLQDGGFYVTADGNDAGSDFIDPRSLEAAASFIPPINEPTGEALSQLDPGFGDALACGDEAAKRAVAEVLWHRRTHTVDDQAMRVALQVRGFETQWVTGRDATYDAWETPVKEFLKDNWALDTIRNELGAAAQAIRFLQSLATNRTRLQAATSEIFTNTTSTHFSWRPRAVLVWAPQVASDFATGSLPRRRLKEVARAARTGTNAQQWWMRKRTDFDVLLERSVRQRNAIIHGRRVVPAVVRSVGPFLERLSSYLANEAVRAATEGRTVDEVLQRTQQRLASDFEKLASEASGEALYPAPE